MPAIISIENKGNPRFIDGKLCPGNGKVTPGISKDGLNAWIKEAPGNALVFGKTVKIFDEEEQAANLKAETDLIKTKVEAEIEGTLRPAIEKELSQKFKEKYEGIVKGLQEQVKVEKEANTKLTKQLNTAKVSKPAKSAGNNGKKAGNTGKEAGAGSGKKDTKIKKSDPDFIFNPEVHHLEARGGSWFVMDQDEKILGALSPEDKAKYEELSK